MISDQDSTETPAAFSSECRALWAAAQAQLGTGADHTAVVQWLEGRTRTTLGKG